MRGLQARNLARDIGFFVVPVEDHGVARVNGGVLEVGPDASPDAIATLACRRQLGREGVSDEDAVRELVEALGYEYVPSHEQRLASGCSGLAYRAVR